MRHYFFLACCLVVAALCYWFIVDKPEERIPEIISQVYTASEDIPTATPKEKLRSFTVSFADTSQKSIKKPKTELPEIAATAEPKKEAAPAPEASAPDGYERIFSGVYMKKEAGIAIIRAELNNPDVRFFVSPGYGTKLVCDHLATNGLQVAINGGGFNMDDTQALFYAMHEGQQYSIMSQPDVTLVVTKSNEVIFLNTQTIPDDAYYAVTGFNRVIENGKILDRFYPGNEHYQVGYDYSKRRTTVGKDDRYLNIVLFDYGTSVASVGEYHLAHFPGTTNVYNLDGGGSTMGCAEGVGPLVTDQGRPVANSFGIYASK